MTERQGIVWLASYPKSGNTWFRIFLTYLLNGAQQELDLNKQTIIGTGAGARFVMNSALGFNSMLLSEDELSVLRPSIYNWHGAKPGLHYIKIHDAYHSPRNQQAIISKHSIHGIIYFARNPLDVVISFAHHMNCSIDEAIHMMNNPFLALKGTATKLSSQVRQICSSWSLHVSSWINNKALKLCMLRYEDMHADPLHHFSRALRHLNLEFSEDQINNALRYSSFAQLQQQEQQQGFRESVAPEHAFFRKGIVGDWQSTLSDKQVAQMITHHGPMMRHLGYLDEENNPIIVTPKEIDNESFCH